MLSESVMGWTQQWKQEGKLEGEVNLLECQLETRFGPLNDTIRNRLNGASEGQLKTWAIRVLSASDLESVFS
jgi:hypothetical protein